MCLRHLEIKIKNMQSCFLFCVYRTHYHLKCQWPGMVFGSLGWHNEGDVLYRKKVTYNIKVTWLEWLMFHWTDLIILVIIYDCDPVLESFLSKWWFSKVFYGGILLPSTCKINYSTCNIIILTCDLFMSTCIIIMLTCNISLVTC